MKTPYIYKGCIHIHSTFSDGTRPPDEIAEIADSVSLDYIIITDHMSPEAQSYEGYYGKTLLLAGYEHHDSEQKNHCLGLGTVEINTSLTDPADYVSHIQQKGGLAFAAHPCEKRNRIPELPPYSWNRWDISELDGLEIWNQFSDWVESLTKINRPMRIFFPRRFQNPPPPELLQKWDTMNLKKKTPGIGGVDAHAIEYKILGIVPLKVFPYKVELQSIRTHVILPEKLTGDLRHDRALIYKAIASGNSFVCNYRAGSPEPFDFHLENKHKERFHCGEETRFENDTFFRISLPAKADIRLLKDGKEIYETYSNNITKICRSPGNYRAEIFRKKKPWIYTNNIYVTG
ncbi:MAG: PHP domain-containing protein [Fibrobacterota bacterium]